MVMITKAVFKLQWDAFSKVAKKAPNVIIVGVDKVAAVMRSCLDDLGLDAHVIVDSERSPLTYLFTHSDDLALVPGNVRHAEHKHLLGGGKN